MLLPLGGCLFRSHSITRAVFVGTLKEATLSDLVQQINANASRIKTLQATVDIDTSLGGSKKGKVTEFQEVRGYILLRKPGNLRMTGLVPVVRNKMFDMVSDGERFRLSVPPKNRFVIGSQEVKTLSKQPFENLRPRQIYDALLVNEIDPTSEVAVLESGTTPVRDVHRKEVDEPNYILTLIHVGNGNPWITRKIYFSREDLSIRKQVLFDRQGNVATIGSYNNYAMEGDMMFPHLIKIERPQEEYAMQLGIVKVQINLPLTNAQFELPRPDGSELQVLDNVTPEADTKGSGAPKGSGRNHRR